jgi:GNAT superfamily N-acetyltransferase
MADDVRLPGGERILVRPVAPDDKPLLAAGFERLSPQTRYRRFFAPLQGLSPTDLRYLTEIDHRDHEALAAIDPATGTLVGVARYVRGVEPELAEVSVVVGDDWQRRGIATVLLERLAQRGRAEGLTHFVALVMSENREALELFEHLRAGSDPPRRSASGHLELVIELPEPGRMRGSLLARALGYVAREAAVTISPYRAMREAIRRLRRD